ncbi:MAG: hypothetical protein ACRDRL_11660 [Sciscionella sp.]
MSENDQVEGEAHRGLEVSEELDEDDLGADPVAVGVTPPEDWVAADRFGTTQREQEQGEPLGARLDQERADVDLDAVPDKPVASTDVTELDERVDDGVAGEPADGENLIAGEERPLPEELD